MRVRAAVLVCLLAGLVALAGCGDDVGHRADDPPPSVPRRCRKSSIGTVRGTARRSPSTSTASGSSSTPGPTCYGNGCADGAPQPPYVDVGQRDAVPFSFPDAGWAFEATFRTGDYGDCPRAITVPVRKTGDRTFEVTPAGPPRRWLVDVFGRGPGGDMITTFTWTTRDAGALAGPATGSAAVLADHDGELDSYGVEIFVQDLARQPGQASATVTVTSAGGDSVTLTPRWERECYSEGSLSFMASDDQGRRATRLGAGPFIYDVALTMDGATYHGLGTWPDDETEDIAPHVPLAWTPALPAYEG